jgi:hypothetical protein
MCTVYYEVWLSCKLLESTQSQKHKRKENLSSILFVCIMYAELSSREREATTGRRVHLRTGVDTGLI